MAFRENMQARHLALATRKQGEKKKKESNLRNHFYLVLAGTGESFQKRPTISSDGTACQTLVIREAMFKLDDGGIKVG